MKILRDWSQNNVSLSYGQIHVKSSIHFMLNRQDSTFWRVDYTRPAW